MNYSKGISWIEDVRIPFVDEGENTMRSQYENKVQVGIMADRPNIKFVGSFDDSAKQGRFPANLLVSDDALNDGTISSKSNRKYKADTNIKNNSMFGIGDTKDKIQMGDKGTNSRYYNIDKWFNNLIDV